MAAEKHTQGPWHLNQRKDSEGEHLQISNSDSLDTVCTLENGANAKLIAAAPEMLEVLERCIEAFRGAMRGSKNDALRTEVEQLIKKARGE